METTQYIVLQGDRWDTISHKCYGVTNRIEEIVRANPHISFGVLPNVGDVLQIPILPEYQVLTDKESLPPWKR